MKTIIYQIDDLLFVLAKVKKEYEFDFEYNIGNDHYYVYVTDCFENRSLFLSGQGMDEYKKIRRVLA